MFLVVGAQFMFRAAHVVHRIAASVHCEAEGATFKTAHRIVHFVCAYVCSSTSGDWECTDNKRKATRSYSAVKTTESIAPHVSNPLMI